MTRMLGAVSAARKVLARRGPGYATYFASGVLWPRAAYTYLWGPDAPDAARAVLYAAGVYGSSPLTADAVSALSLPDDAPGYDGSRQSVTGRAERLLDRAHASGITGLRYYLEDLEHAASNGGRWRPPAGSRLRHHDGRGVFFLAERDADRVAFNRHFTANLLTERSVRAELKALQARVPPGYRDYAPIDFGGGLVIGQVAATDSGTGRWQFFNERVVAPLVRGRRVLDLGSNNGSLPLMMARAGAASVVGLEMTPQIADFARFNARVLSWRDLRPYDIRIETGDMRRMLSGELGTFDVVTAFCSLYYLPPEDMARVVRAAHDMGATIILQSNDVITNLPARTDDLRSLLEHNGYERLSIHSYPGFARNLLVGYPGGAEPR